MPSGEATATAARTCSLRPATRTWKKSSRFWLKMARKRTRSSRGSLRVLGHGEHPLVEVEPGQLPVEEPGRLGTRKWELVAHVCVNA